MGNHQYYVIALLHLCGAIYISVVKFLLVNFSMLLYSSCLHFAFQGPGVMLGYLALSGMVLTRYASLNYQQIDSNLKEKTTNLDYVTYSIMFLVKQKLVFKETCHEDLYFKHGFVQEKH